MSGIYLHIPFCKQACHYCDFHFSTSLKKKEDMLRAIKTELLMRKDEISGVVNTVYFGGGTPSLLTIGEIQELLAVVKENYRLTEFSEITLEANPDDLDAEKILALKDSPVNRLSIGIQSFFDQDLKFMNRAHNEKQAKESLTMASRHFDNISIDLIYGVPNLSTKRWKDNLKQTFDFGVAHISSYALTVEPKTALDHFIKSGKYPPLDESLAKSHFEILQKETNQRNYIQYEISNFGREGYFSKHNTSYWNGTPYLGIGPSAHSYDGMQRSWNIANNAKYVSSIQNEVLPCEKEKLGTEDRINEAIMTGLRTMWGVSLDAIEKNYGKRYKDNILRQAQKHLDQKTIKLENDHLFITAKGYFLVDGISSDLFLLKV
jgi:oxygen-independent coproporphyrinogen-3 oxidase